MLFRLENALRVNQENKTHAGELLQMQSIIRNGTFVLECYCLSSAVKTALLVPVKTALLVPVVLLHTGTYCISLF